MNDLFLNLEKYTSSARQFSELSASIEATQAVIAKANAIKLKGAEAQIESSRILAEQREELEVMRDTINALLKHSLEQAEQQEERNRIESKRHREAMIFTVIAAVTGIISLMLQWKSH